MILPEEYIDEYYRHNMDSFNSKNKNKYQNINFGRLTADKKQLQISIDIFIREDFKVRDRLDWDLGEEKKSPELFTETLVEGLKDVIEPGMIEFNKTNIRDQILDQILEHVEKNTNFPRLRLIKKENENPNNQLCANCNTIIYNPEFCVNCMFIFEKKVEKKANPEAPSEDQKTERQKIIELRQKNINFDDITVAVSFTPEGKDKKVCKKCSEVSSNNVTECKNCKYKFPLTSYFDFNSNQSYAVHFWDKINKNSTVQQLKNFSDNFTQGDICSIKYLYNKIKVILDKEYRDILTEEAYIDLMKAVEKVYFSFSNPTFTTEKVFESAYYTKFSKPRLRSRMLNFNNLIDIKEGYLPDNLPDRNVEEKKEEKIKSNDPFTKRKRGRPKKVEIFKNEVSSENDILIIPLERDNLLKTDLILDEDTHYDVCGICEEEGKLICCETCSSAYHFECFGYDRFPRGKFKCYFCKIIKVGIDEATTIDKNQMKLIKKLITYNRKAKWQCKAVEFLDVLKAHPCSSFLKSPVPEDVERYHNKVKEHRDLTLVEIKLMNKDYHTLKDFIQDLYLIWANFKNVYTPNSFFYKQANSMENFMAHLIREENIFDSFDAETGKERETRDRNREEEKDDEIAIVI